MAKRAAIGPVPAMVRILRVGACAVALVVASAFAQALLAQEPNPRAELDAAFEEMLDDLANPAKSFRYADLAVRTGEVRGAVAALERLLLLNPNLDNIRLELGVLYYELGSYDLARAYLEQALQAEDIPPTIAERAETYLAAAERAASPHAFSGSLYAAGRYDTNVNLAPGSTEVVAFGFPAELRPDDTEDDDFSAVVAGSLRYVYDLQRQNTNRIEANAAAYLQDYFDRDDFDTALLEADVGPWIEIGRPFGGPFSLRPYVTGTYFTLEEESYLTQYGGGLTMRGVLSPALAVTVTGQFRDQEFYDSDRRPNASDQDGTEALASAALLYALTDASRIALLGRYVRDEAREDFETNDQIQLSASYTLELPDPLAVSADPWSTTLSVSYRRLDYDAPDRTVDPNTAREDDRYEFRLTTAVPVAASLLALATIEYTKNDSNLPNFEYENTAVSIGMLWVF